VALSVRILTREDDEMHLDWLARLEACESAASIWRLWGVTRKRVEMTVSRILRASA
jgi:hypothetical protein